MIEQHTWIVTRIVKQYFAVEALTKEEAIVKSHEKGDPLYVSVVRETIVPYRAVVEKVDRIRAENEELKARIRELEGLIDSEQKTQIDE